MAIKWNDATSYSRDDKEHKQRWWSTKAGLLTINVGNSHAYYPDDGKTWLMHCHPWFDTRELKAKNADEAKAEALDLVKNVLKQSLSALEK